jgi:hypothetical protein
LLRTELVELDGARPVRGGAGLGAWDAPVMMRGSAPPSDTPTAAGSSESARDDVVVGEARWPMAATVAAAVVLTALLPDALRAGPRWLLPFVEGVLLVAVIVGDPGKIDRRSKALRWLSIALVAVLVFSSLWSTAQLTDDLIHAGPETSSASDLLEAGSLVWLSTVIAFALLYWQLDGGGPAARAHHLRAHPDLAFPQQLNPELAPADRRPRFVDYLYLGFTNATALSPTDTMRWRHG